MSARQPLPRLPYVLLGAMTFASFGGPFVILVVVRGGSSARWPPDRPVEWVAIALVFGSGRLHFSSRVFRSAGGIAERQVDKRTGDQ